MFQISSYCHSPVSEAPKASPARDYLKNKLKGIKLDPALADKYFDDINLLVRTRLIYPIVGLQNSSSLGPEVHAIKEVVLNNKPALMIKKEGAWIPVRDLQKTLGWDKGEGKYVSKNQPNQYWNYFHEGLVPVDRHFRPREGHQDESQNGSLYPVARITEDEVKTLLEHAKKFDGFNDPNAKNHDKPECIVQFFTDPDRVCKYQFANNFNAQNPVHCGIQIVMNDGRVYSTGLGSTNKEYKDRKGLKNLLATTNAQPTNMDYVTFKHHEGRLITSIPVDAACAESIIENLNYYRKISVPFNLIKQNCMQLGTDVLEQTGVAVNIQVPIKTMLYRMLPDIMPKPLRNLLGRVKRLAGKTIPAPARKALEAAATVFLFVPRKTETLFINLLFSIVGGRKGAYVSDERLKPPQTKFGLKHFDRLVADLFDDHASDIQHSSVFIHWQLRQASTVVHSYSGQPCMNILPPMTQEEIQFSKEKIDKWREVYKWSTPVS